MVQKVFNRIEKKYMLNSEQYRNIRERLEPFMEMDHYGLHTIRNVYYDTETDELIRTSLEKPAYKEKFRIRCYGEPDENTDIFMEIKKKYKGIVNKRRITLKPEEVKKYFNESELPLNQGQIFQEIDYFHKRYQLKPKLYLAYDRIALFGKEDAEFRVTFDQNIRSRRENPSLFSDENTERLLEDGMYLMEVKITNAVPMWFVSILSELKIYNTSFSKYGSVYQREVMRGIHNYSVKTGTVIQEEADEKYGYAVEGSMAI